MALQENLRRIEIPSLLPEKEAFRTRIIGQEESVDAFATLLAKLRSGIRSTKPGPIDIKFLAGPSGVGKTEMVYTLVELLAEDETNPRAKVIKINGGEYQEEHTVARLLGSPPGYRGSEDPQYPNYKSPALFSQENLDANRIFYTDRKGQRRDVLIILVDEAEKAHDALHRAFLSVLDKGQMTTGNNQTSDFSNAVIFYTSNVGNQEVEGLQQGSVVERDTARAVVTEAFRNAFPPEFRGRVKELIVFEHLDVEAIKQITIGQLRKVEEQFAHNGIRIGLELSPAALAWIINQGYNRSEGVRALEKVIEARIQDRLLLAGDSIHRKLIYADREQNDSELSFYFNEGEQLPELPETNRAVNQVVSVRPTAKQEQPVAVIDQGHDVPRVAEESRGLVRSDEAEKITRQIQADTYRLLQKLFSNKPVSRDLDSAQAGHGYLESLLEVTGIPKGMPVKVWWEKVEMRGALDIFEKSIPTERRLVLHWDTIDGDDIAYIALGVDTISPPNGPTLTSVGVFSNRKRNGTLTMLDIETGSYIDTNCLSTTSKFDHIVRGSRADVAEKAKGIIQWKENLPPHQQLSLLSELTLFLS